MIESDFLKPLISLVERVRIELRVLLLAEVFAILGVSSNFWRFRWMTSNGPVRTVSVLEAQGPIS